MPSFPVLALAVAFAPSVLASSAAVSPGAEIVGMDRRVVETTLAVEANPLDIAMGPDGEVYVGQFATGKIAEIRQRKVVRSVAVGGGVTGLAMSKDGRRLWAGLANENAIVLLDPETLTVKKRIGGCGFVIGVRLTPDEKNVVAVCHANDALLIAPASLEGAAAVVPIGDMPYYVAISPDSRTAWATNHTSGTVSVVSLPEKKVIETVTVGSAPVGVALTSDGETAYVANFGSGDVSVISTSTRKVTKTLRAGSNPYWVAAHPTRAFVVVTNHASSWLDVFHVDGAHTRIDFKDALTQVFLSPDGRRMFTTAWGHAAVGIIE